MKIDKKLIKELSENLDEFNLTEISYSNGITTIKVSKASSQVSVVNSSPAIANEKKVEIDPSVQLIKKSYGRNRLPISRTRCKTIRINW